MAIPKQGEGITLNTNQLIVITGPRGSGKSTMAATYLKPSQLHRVACIDNENSMNNFRRGLMAMDKDFGLYINTLERFKHELPSSDDLLSRLDKGAVPWVNDKEQNMFVDFFKYILKEINQIPFGKFDCLIIDPGEKIESGMAAYVEANKRKFGITDTSYGRLWTNGIFPLYQHLLQGIWDRGINTIIFTFHLKNVWQGKQPVPGKVTHSGKKLLYYLSSLMIWLVNEPRNPNGEPAGLVLKERLGKVSVVGDEWDIKSMLPNRLPVCTWKEISRYMLEGYNHAKPLPTELLSASESDMISELLNDAQIRLMLETIEVEKQENTLSLAASGLLPITTEESVSIGEDGAAQLGPKNKSEAITRWKASGKTVPELLKRLNSLSISTDEQIAERWNEIEDRL